MDCKLAMFPKTGGLERIDEGNDSRDQCRTVKLSNWQVFVQEIVGLAVDFDFPAQHSDSNDAFQTAMKEGQTLMDGVSIARNFNPDFIRRRHISYNLHVLITLHVEKHVNNIILAYMFPSIFSLLLHAPGVLGCCLLFEAFRSKHMIESMDEVISKHLIQLLPLFLPRRDCGR